jgi:hypothetical protein
VIETPILKRNSSIFSLKVDKKESNSANIKNQDKVEKLPEVN